MVVVSYQSDERGFVVWRRTRNERLFPKCTGTDCFSLRLRSYPRGTVVGWMGSFCRDVVCGGLETP